MTLEIEKLFLANFTTNHPTTAPETFIIAKIIIDVSKNPDSE